MKTNIKWLLAVFSVLAMLGVWYAWDGCDRECRKLASDFNERTVHHAYVVEEAKSLRGFDLLDPEESPPEIKSSVMRGYYIIMDTQQYAKEYAGDRLNCTNCHFNGGDSLGGKNNGISLVGVTTQYPSYSARFDKMMTLADRINNCFERSMNGKALSDNSQEMKDIIAYLAWISKEVSHFRSLPWLGLLPIKSRHEPDRKKGEAVYYTYCAMCHQADGSGQIEGSIEDYPPVWGPSSFNDGAGMSALSTLAPFIYWNMPLGNPALTEEEALDVAAYILYQPRPDY